MNAKRVLAVGLDPRFVDLGAPAEFTPEIVRAYINQQIEQVRVSGYDVDSILVDAGETAEQTIGLALRSRDYDCIVIGAGLRQPPEFLLLFEKVINLVHRLAPHSRIAFNTSPADTGDAVRRWLSGQPEA